MEGSAKLLAVQSGRMWAEVFKDIFYFYLCWPWNKYCIVESVNFMCQVLSPVHPITAELSKAKCTFEEALPLKGRRKKPGRWQNASKWVSLPCSKAIWVYSHFSKCECWMKSSWRQQLQKDREGRGEPCIFFLRKWHYTDVMYVQRLKDRMLSLQTGYLL